MESTGNPRVNGGAIPTLLVYTITLFLASGLMFAVEPFIAKMLLPFFGGSPNVWNTCVVFFQLMLLAGYVYAHYVGTRLSLTKQLIIQAIVIWLPVVFLPIRIPSGISIGEQPVVSLLLFLSGLIGVFFFALCTTAPLLQKWYSQSGSIGSADPYFLYAASNAGGLLGLILYPFLFEPNFKTAELSTIVSNSYISYGVLVTACGLALFLRTRGRTVRHGAGSEANGGEAAPGSKQLARWILFTMVPASLVLGLTSYITSELSAVPFFWVAPLFIYLTSFILAFLNLPAFVLSIAKAVTPLVALVVVMLTLSHTIAEASFGDPLITTTVSLHLVSLFLICLTCHATVAAERPATSQLTQYYIAISVGGILGSCINTFVAPLVFKGWTEYPLMIMVAAIMLARLPAFRERAESTTGSIKWFSIPVLVLMVSLASWTVYETVLAQKSEALSLGGQYVVKEAIYQVLSQVLIPIAACLTLARSTIQFRAALAVVAAIFLFTDRSNETIVYQGRNFFGSLSVVLNKNQNSCEFWHGNTIHGTESLDPAKRGMPTSYFYPTGPIGVIMRTLIGEPQSWNAESTETISEKQAPIAVLGLGCGTTAAYAKRNQPVVYYEINPEVIEVASNPLYFTYLFQAKKRNVDLKIVQGDARLEIQKAPYDHYRMILVDAFSSDSIPMHLITKEAAEIYFKKLKHDGVLAFNISNQYYDLKPVLAALSNELKVPALVLSDPEDSFDDERYSTEWVVFSRSEEVLETLRKLGGLNLQAAKAVRLWTDDYCSPLTVLSVPLH